MKAERFFEGEPVAAPDETVIAPRTREDIFDRVVRHYRKQPVRCPIEGRGLYRNGAAMCFVGPLIDDDHYSPHMEGYHARDLPKLFAMPQWFKNNIEFITDLQHIHDTETNWPEDRMDIVLELFAAERGLTMPLPASSAAARRP